MDGPWWLVSMGAAFALGNYFRTKIHPLMEVASAGQERFGRYAAILGLLLEADMESPALRELQRSVRSTPVGAGQELRRLGRRVAWADIRYSSMAHAPLQASLSGTSTCWLAGEVEGSIGTSRPEVVGGIGGVGGPFSPGGASGRQPGLVFSELSEDRDRKSWQGA